MGTLSVRKELEFISERDKATAAVFVRVKRN